MPIDDASVEESIRAALSAEAQEIEPRYRWDDVVARTRRDAPSIRRRPRWLVPAAAAVLVGAVVVGVVGFRASPVGQGWVGVPAATPTGTRATGWIGPLQTTTGSSYPIRITSPTGGAVVASTSSVVVAGTAIVFEAQLGWSLSGPVTRSGFVRASAGPPTGGTYRIELGTLPGGNYVLRVYANSPKDGSVLYERLLAFTVR